MANLPRHTHERQIVERLIRRVSRPPQDEDVLPFTDDPTLCPKCGGALTVVQVTKHRRGKVVTQVLPEQIVCPRCDGLSRPYDADQD